MYRVRNVQKIISRILDEKGVEVIHNADIVGSIGLSEVNEINHREYLVASDGRKFDFDEAIWCTHAQGQSWLQSTGLEVTADGFICVKSTLESTNTRDVFACGDIAHFVDNPRPKAGVFAVRAG